MRRVIYDHTLNLNNYHSTGTYRHLSKTQSFLLTEIYSGSEPNNWHYIKLVRAVEVFFSFKSNLIKKIFPKIKFILGNNTLEPKRIKSNYFVENLIFVKQYYM